MLRESKRERRRKNNNWESLWCMSADGGKEERSLRRTIHPRRGVRTAEDDNEDDDNNNARRSRTKRLTRKKRKTMDTIGNSKKGERKKERTPKKTKKRLASKKMKRVLGRIPVLLLVERTLGLYGSNCETNRSVEGKANRNLVCSSRACGQER